MVIFASFLFICIIIIFKANNINNISNLIIEKQKENSFYENTTTKKI